MKKCEKDFCFNFCFKNVSGDSALTDLIFCLEVEPENKNMFICYIYCLTSNKIYNFYYVSHNYSPSPTFQLKFHLKNLFDGVLWSYDTKKKVRFICVIELFLDF